MAEGDEKKSAEKAPAEKAEPKRASRQVKATQRLENQGFLGDGSPRELFSGSGVPQLADSWIVEKDEFVPIDHPAVTLHPTYFEGV